MCLIVKFNLKSCAENHLTKIKEGTPENHLTKTKEGTPATGLDWRI